jgi:hypothetical protein
MQAVVFTHLPSRHSPSDIVDAYEAFDRRADGWIKVEVKPSATRGKATRPEASARPRVKHEHEARA